MYEEVLEVAKRYLQQVKKSGPENIMALCPFHDNKNSPSFTMSLTQGLYYCFSCQERGNLFTFLRDVGVKRVVIEREYRSLIDGVASQIVRKATPLRPHADGLKNESLPEHLLGLFEFCPLALLDEGFDEDFLQKLDIGFDNAHMRITYPLRELNGTLVGISGRAVNDERPRYKVYDKEFEDWDLGTRKTYKSHLLWNGHRAYPEVYFQPKPLIIVEGYKACMRMIQAGAGNTVAIMGSEVAEKQRWQIERMANEVWMFLDQNEAGFLGTVRAGMRFGLPTRLLMYPDDREQPSDLSVEEIQLALSQPQDFHRWLVQTPEAMTVYRELKRKEQKNKERYEEQD